MKRLLLSFLVFAGACGAPAQPETSAATANAGVRTTAEFDTLLRDAVQAQRVPYVVAIVATNGQVAYERAEGISADAIFAIASMTKPITTIAAMQLVEAGKIKLDEQAATYVPEIAQATVLEAGRRRSPKSAITVRQLMNHTSGFGYEFMNRDLFELVSTGKLPSVSAGGDGFLKAPLVADPGARWEYGIGTDWLGKIVERVSGQTLDVYFRQHIFDPLGMSDTFFVVPAEKQPRVSRLFVRAKDGGLSEAPPRPAPPPPTFFSGGGGLSSTARDYMTLLRTVGSGGALGQTRILTPESIGLMGQNQIGELTLRPFPSLMPALATDNAALTGDLDKFGLGFALNSKPTASGRAANTLAWAGIYNTFFWVDREHHVAAVLLTQMMPGLDPGPARLLEEFDRAVYRWIAQP
jgi:CubicO group peptidase (beta-lactamase class C family)